MSGDPYARKLVVVGDGFCGKTCLLIAFAKGKFEETYTPTIFETDVATIQVDGRMVELGLWDTAGQEDYDRLRPLSYPDTNVVVMVYSVDNRDSIQNVTDRWLPEVRHFCPNVPIVLVATKRDLRPSSDSPHIAEFVTNEEGQALAKTIGARQFVETSALKMEGINLAFTAAARASMEKSSGKTHKLCQWL